MGPCEVATMATERTNNHQASYMESVIPAPWCLIYLVFRIIAEGKMPEVESRWMRSFPDDWWGQYVREQYSFEKTFHTLYKATCIRVYRNPSKAILEDIPAADPDELREMASKIVSVYAQNEQTILSYSRDRRYRAEVRSICSNCTRILSLFCGTPIPHYHKFLKPCEEGVSLEIIPKDNDGMLVYAICVKYVIDYWKTTGLSDEEVYFWALEQHIDWPESYVVLDDRWRKIGFDEDKLLSVKAPKPLTPEEDRLLSEILGRGTFIDAISSIWSLGEHREEFGIREYTAVHNLEPDQVKRLFKSVVTETEFLYANKDTIVSSFTPGGEIVELKLRIESELLQAEEDYSSLFELSFRKTLTDEDFYKVFHVFLNLAGYLDFDLIDAPIVSSEDVEGWLSDCIVSNERLKNLLYRRIGEYSLLKDIKIPMIREIERETRKQRALAELGRFFCGPDNTIITRGKYALTRKLLNELVRLDFVAPVEGWHKAVSSLVFEEVGGSGSICEEKVFSGHFAYLASRLDWQLFDGVFTHPAKGKMSADMLRDEFVNNNPAGEKILLAKVRQARIVTRP